jgi:DNA helicase HerA-like ATPase
VQMGNRVQHALRAYTPREQKAVKTAADTFRPNPKFKTEKAITELGKGEALVSVLDLKGVPTMVERTFIRPPQSRLGPITPDERAKLIRSSPVYGQYDETEDRESAYEMLTQRASERAEAQEKAAADKAAAREARSAPRQRESATDRFVKNVAGSVGRQVGSMVVRSLVRGILGGFTRR